MKNLLILTALLSSSCMLFQKPPQEDMSIRFPEFYERLPITIGEQGQAYELDGVTLRAITIAANDFIPPGYKSRSCLDRQETHRYRIIRQGDIIFVNISGNPAACKEHLNVLAGGAKYAISTDGRILRRVFDGEPEGPFGLESPDAGERESTGWPVPTSLVGNTSLLKVSPDLPSWWFDGGTRGALPESPPTPSPAPDSRDAGSLVSDGGVQTPDGGSPGVSSPPSPPDAG